MKSLMIVLDSPDCTGKTTLANALSKKSKIPIAPYFTSQQPLSADKHRMWAEANYNFLVDFISFYPNRLILDRWAMTEYCYSPVKRGYSYDGYWDLEAKLHEKIVKKDIRFLWIYLSCPTEILKSRFIEMNEKSISFDDLLLVTDNYEKLFMKSSLPKLDFNTSIHSVDECVAKIKKFIPSL